MEGEGQRGRASPWGATQAVLSPPLYTRRSLPCFSPWGLLPGLPYPPPSPSPAPKNFCAPWSIWALRVAALAHARPGHGPVHL